MGATNDNLAELKKTDPKKVCGIKVFMGSSTGNMLVDSTKALEGIFAESPVLVATHCEDEDIIKANERIFLQKFGDALLPEHHPLIRNEEACYRSSAKAVDLATRYDTQLHILHLSTAKEMSLFTTKPLSEKKITGEVCVHHLWFDNSDYAKYGYKIKWNPAIKTARDKDALLEALKSGKLDVIATDHAPHTMEEKFNAYQNSASGGPLVQHSLIVMLELFHQNKISLETIVRKMCHAPADLFRIEKRGYVREGYFADLVLVDKHQPYTVTPSNIIAKCKWSPFEGQQFSSTVTHTFVNGNLVFENGQLNNQYRGNALIFNR